MRIKIDGEVYEVDKVYKGGQLPLLECGKMEFYVAADSEEAGEAAADYWRDMAKNDKKEFRCIIGDKRLLQWVMGESDSFGISSLEEFYEVTATVPEEQWAGYDGQEREVEAIEEPSEDEEAGLAGLAGLEETDIDLLFLQQRDRRLELEAAKELWEAWQDLIEELGFTPTVAYRHN